MQVFLVMRDEDTPAADSLFLRDGFSGWAFLLAPFWLLRHALWLPLLAYVLAVIGIALLNVGGEGFLVLLLTLHAFFGLEGQGMRATALARGGHAVKAIVAGDEADDAEVRYFADMPPEVAQLTPPLPGAGPDESGPL